MDKTTVLIVDDEKPARRALRSLLAKEPECAIVGEAADGEEALRRIRDLRPQLVFLDVQMPVMTGIDVLHALRPAERPVIVFVTAYDQYALKAFEIHAVDYLVKPLSPRRFAEALGRARLRLRGDAFKATEKAVTALLQQLEQGRGRPSASPTGPARRIVVRADGEHHFVDPLDLRWVEAQSDYIRLHLISGQPALMVRLTMARLLEQLDAARFCRIHKSTIVNLDCVRRFWTVAEPQGHFVELDDGTELAVGRHYREHFKEVRGAAGSTADMG